MTFWLTKRLLKQHTILTRPSRRIFHPPALMLPRQPLYPVLRLSAGKRAANYRVIRGGGDNPKYARPPSTASSCAVREHRDRPRYPTPCFSSRQVVA
jgi:hypothetical protein